MERLRPRLIEADLPSSSWTFALKHVVYVRKRVQHCALNYTPFSIPTGAERSLKNPGVFGFAGYVLRLIRATKFQSCSIEGAYLETLGHGIYDVLLTDDEGILEITESRHAAFHQFVFPDTASFVNYM